MVDRPYNTIITGPSPYIFVSDSAKLSPHGVERTHMYFLHYLTWHLFEYVLLSFKNSKMHVGNR